MYPKNTYMQVNQELGVAELSLFACPGMGNRPPRKTKFANPRRYAREGGGGGVMVRGQINHALHAKSKIRVPKMD